MIMRRLLALLALTALVGMTPARAVSYQDLWWNAAESGWGINILHQGDTLVATWFIYDTDGKPLWLLGTASKTATGVYAGEVYKYTGPYYGAATFDTTGVTESAVGNAEFRFTDIGVGSVRYTVNGTTITKYITRQTYAWPKIEGDYFSAAMRSWSGCSDVTLNGVYYQNRIYRLTRAENSLKISYGALDGSNNYVEQCSAAGSMTVSGSSVNMSAPFTCTTGAIGTVSLTDVNAVDVGLLGTITWKYNASSPSYANCTVVGTTGAVRW